jgi:hypothetical protein
MSRAWRRFLERARIAGELARFLASRRLWWFVPLFALLLLFTGILVFAEATALGPFIYALF